MKMSLRNRWLILTAVMIVVLCVSVALDAMWFSSYRIHTKYQTVSRSDIPASHDGMSIVCFGDLEYGTFMNQSRLENLIDTVNKISPDTILFLGDLYDRTYTPTEEEVVKLISLLSSLKAPEGKFAVLGDMDYSRSEAIEKDLTNAGFEVLNNSVIQLHHGTNEYIDLVGFNTNSIDAYTVSSMYTDMESDVFKIVMAHSPDIADLIPISSTDWVIGANAHNSQIRIPIIESFTKNDTSNKYAPGRHISDGLTIYATSGVGTTGTDTRLFSDPEILVLKLSSSK